MATTTASALRRMRCALPALLAAVFCAAPASASAATATLAPPLSGTGCVAVAITGCAGAATLDGASAVALAPDGSAAFAVARDASTLTVLRRDAGGGLAADACFASLDGSCTGARALGAPAAVTVSGDGRMVAVASADGVALFLRDPGSGVLTQPAGVAGCASETGSGGQCLDGRALASPQDVAFSADGTRLFVASGSPSNGVAVLRTDPAAGITGEPSGAAGCWTDSGTSGQCGNGSSLVGAGSVAATSNGAVVAASGSSALVRLTVNPSTGALSQAYGAAGCIREIGTFSCGDGRALAGASEVAVTPDGSTALVAASSGDSVTAVALGATLTQSGALSACISDTGSSGQCLDGRGLDGVAGLAVAPDGRTAYAAAGVSDALAILDLAGGTLAQSADGSGCVADRGTPDCLGRAGLDGARGVAVDTRGRPVTTADTSDAVVGFRLTRAPACTGAEASTTWDTPVDVDVTCTDPDGDPLTLRVVSGTRGADVRLNGTRLKVIPLAGTETTARIGVRASDGALDSATATVTVKISAPPPPPPKAAPDLPAELSAPILGVERRPIDPSAAATKLTTFCLPRRATTCSGTIELHAGASVLGQTPATGPGEATVSLSADARRALRSVRRAAAISHTAIPTGWQALGGTPDAMTISLPVRVPRRGVSRTGGQGRDRLRGGSGDDRLSGRNSGDRLFGFGGDDRLVGGGGSDRLAGGAGQDDVSGNFAPDRLEGGAGDDTLRGGSGDDRLTGGSDADRLDGGTGNDRLEGGPGDDVLDGFDGDDTLRGGAGDDYLVETRFGDDVLLDGGPGDDYVDGNRGNDQAVRGGEGNDIVLGGPGSDDVDGGPGDDVVDGGAGEDPSVRGGSGDDVIVGGRGNDTLEGGEGSDVLYGSTGEDRYDCGPGEDWAFVDSTTEAKRAKGCEHITNGDPTRDGAYDPVALVANRGLARGGVNAMKRGSALGDTPSPDRPIGTAGDDELVGTGKRDLINGNDGNDLVSGLGGNDDLDGGEGDDELRGGEGRDRLFGRFGDDDIHGEAGNDELEGGRGEDTLDGGPGSDTLNGGFDDDVLRGGTGNDRITAVAGGVDDIDCGPGRDRADVDRNDIVRNCEDVRRH